MAEARDTRTRRARRLTLAASLVLCASAMFGISRAGEPALPALDDVLASLNATSRTYLDNALRFTCDETIVHYMGNGHRAYRFNYIYAFNDQGVLKDHRLTRRGWDKIASGKREPDGQREVQLYEYGLPTYMSRAYNWIFIFDAARWRLYDYELLGRDIRMDRPALKVGFRPRSSDADPADDWVGTAWVDAESYQLLHVEAQRLEDYRKQQQLERDLAEARSWKPRRKASHAIFRVETTYGIERDGMRLPSDVQLETTRYVVRGGQRPPHHFEYPGWSVHQSYDNYQLFDVDVEGRVGKYFERRRRNREP